MHPTPPDLDSPDKRRDIRQGFHIDVELQLVVDLARHAPALSESTQSRQERLEHRVSSHVVSHLGWLKESADRE